MPMYETLPENVALMQNKTHGFVIVKVENVDAGLFWQKAGGDVSGKLKATLLKPSGSTVEKLSEDGEVFLVNTDPQRIKILVEPSDLDFVGKLKVFPEFAFDDSWLPGAVQELSVVDDPIPTV